MATFVLVFALCFALFFFFSSYKSGSSFTKKVTNYKRTLRWEEVKGCEKKIAATREKRVLKIYFGNYKRVASHHKNRANVALNCNCQIKKSATVYFLLIKQFTLGTYGFFSGHLLSNRCCCSYQSEGLSITHTYKHRAHTWCRYISRAHSTQS